MTNLLLPEADGAVLLFTLSVIVDVTINCILIRTLSDVLNFQDSAFRDFHAVSVSPFISPFSDIQLLRNASGHPSPDLSSNCLLHLLQPG